MAFRVNARTVLELGSELISSDIIAFYELIKNAFDAGSRTGADIRFQIAMRRNDYLRIRDRAQSLIQEKASKSERADQLADLIGQVAAKLNLSAGSETVAKFNAAVEESEDLNDFVRHLDACYDDHNSIEISDTGSGMSLAEISKNFLTIGTPARKREVDQILTQGGSKTPLGEKGIGRLSAMRLGERRIPDPIASPTETATPKVSPRIFSSSPLDASFVWPVALTATCRAARSARTECRRSRARSRTGFRGCRSRNRGPETQLR